MDILNAFESNLQYIDLNKEDNRELVMKEIEKLDMIINVPTKIVEGIKLIESQNRELKAMIAPQLNYLDKPLDKIKYKQSISFTNDVLNKRKRDISKLRLEYERAAIMAERAKAKKNLYLEILSKGSETK